MALVSTILSTLTACVPLIINPTMNESFGFMSLCLSLTSGGAEIWDAFQDNKDKDLNNAYTKALEAAEKRILAEAANQGIDLSLYLKNNLELELSARSAIGNIVSDTSFKDNLSSKEYDIVKLWYLRFEEIFNQESAKYPILSNYINSLILKNITRSQDELKMLILDYIRNSQLPIEQFNADAGFKTSFITKNIHFTGRANVLKELNNLLKTHHLVALWGLGGLGKSEVLKQYYLEHKMEYNHHVFLSWISDNGSLSTWQELFISSLNVSIDGFENETIEERYERTRQTIYNQLDGRKLIIIDAIPIDASNDVLKELSSLDADVLISSRKKPDLYFKHFQLDVLSQAESIALFCSCANIEPHAISEAENLSLVSIMETSGNYPLAIELIARIHEAEHNLISDTQEQIDNLGLAFSETKVDALWSGNEQYSLIQNFIKILNLYHIEANSSIANTLSLYAIFPSLPVSSNDIINWVKWDKSAKTQWHVLEKLALIKWDQDSRAYVMHQVIAEAIRIIFPLEWEVESLGETLLLGISEAIDWDNTIIPNIPSGFTRYIPYINSLLKYGSDETTAQAILERRLASLYLANGYYHLALEAIERTILHVQKDESTESLAIIALNCTKGNILLKNGYIELANKEFEQALLLCPDNENQIKAQLYLGLGSVYFQKGNYVDMIAYLSYALEIQELLLSNLDPQLAVTYGNLAAAYSIIGDFKNSLDFQIKSSTIQEQVLGFDHPETALSYNNIGQRYMSQGEISKALEYFKKALSIYTTAFTDEHPDTALIYNNISACLYAQGNFSDAVSLGEKAYRVFQNFFSVDHPEHAKYTCNLALSYHSMGERQKAQVLFEEAQSLIEHSPEATQLTQLALYQTVAIFYAEQENYELAIEYFEKALSVREIMRVIHHPETISLYFQLGTAYNESNNLEKANEFFLKALSLYEAFPDLNIDVIDSVYFEIAENFLKLENFLLALEFYEKVIEIEKEMELKQPKTTTCYERISKLLNLISIDYASKGDYSASIALLYRALDVRREFLEINHLESGNIYFNIASCYSRQKEYDTAIELYERALTEYYGVSHQLVADTYYNIGITYISKKNFSEAITALQKSLEIRTEALGINHPHTVKTLLYIADAYYTQKNYACSLTLYLQAIAIVEEKPVVENHQISISYNHIASIYYFQGDISTALEWYLKDAAFNEKHFGTDQNETAISYINVAASYEIMNNPENAITWYKKALAIQEMMHGMNSQEAIDTHSRINNATIILKSKETPSKTTTTPKKRQSKYR